MNNKDENKFTCCSTNDESCCSDNLCSDEGCSCGCEDDEEYINVENVAEISIEENGTVHLLVVDDNGENPQEFAVEFPTFEDAEAWVKETFGEEIFEAEQ